MSPKEIVKSLYQSDIINDKSVLDTFFHKEVKVYWNGSEGLSVMDFEDLKKFFDGIRRSYADLRAEVSHLLEDEQYVTIRHKFYMHSIENPDEEIEVSHFMTIWEVKDEKIIRGHQISQPASKNDGAETDYETIKM